MQKFQRQLELENEAINAGIQTYRKAVATHQVSDLPPGVAMLKNAMVPMVNAIEVFLSPGKCPPRVHAIKNFLKSLHVTPEELAYLTLRCCINSIGKKANIQTAAISLMDTVMDQHEYKKFKATHKNYLRKLEEDLKLSTQRHRRTVVMLKKRKFGVEDDKIEREDKLIIGCKLIELCILSTGLVEKTLVNDVYCLQASEKAQKWVERVNERCEMLNPVLLPMVVPPKPWQGVTGGGYLASNATFRFKLVKTRNRAIIEELVNHDMPKVYEALNTIQETPWRINARVYEVAATLWEGLSTLAGLPARDREELPRRPWNSDEEYERLKAENPDVITTWKRQAAVIYEEFYRNKSKRTATSMKLRTAERFLDEEEIYFPHVLDWRGRVYPIPNFMNPQGDDLGKALIEFKNGLPLGEEGLDWLKIHLANTYGIDKVSFADRMRWVDENEAALLDSAENPLDGSRFWCEADSPFCFLAACFEYAEAVKQGPSFVSHLPVALDGTCSGLQHFSAMLKDAVGGEAVNLLPAEKPQDIYQRVADKVIEMVNEDAANGIDEAKVWQGKIDRGIAKRAVMTSPYGAKKYGFKDQLLHELKKRGKEYLGDADLYPACIYLAGKLWDAIGQVVIAAREAMDWLQEVAKVCSKVETPITWTTPVGFKARQEYFKTSAKRVDTFFGSVRVRLTVTSDTDKMDTQKQANGISPNFVHSMDASHLMKTVLTCKEKGITDFAMIHDSFGTHACNASVLAATLRETFVEQYSRDVLEDFRTEILQQLPEELQAEIPPVPAKGSLNLESVKQSPYFFA